MPETNLSDEKVLEIFVDNMITDKGVQVDAAQREALRQQLVTELNGTISQAIVMALPDEKAIELDQKIDAGMPDDEVESFFMNSGIDFEAVTGAAMKHFRMAYLGAGVEA